jgi:raffinose/stachyose/melibiose transport system substrate-binding protein
VQVIYKPFADYTASARLAASEPGGPDILEVSPASGNGTYNFVHDDLLRPLDSYAKQYGWTSAKYGSDFPPSLFRFSANGLREGVGSLYAVPEGFAEFEGVYYNKALLARLHMSVPTTMAAFSATLAAAKRAGITPIVLDSRDQYGWGFMWEDLASALTPANALNAWFLGHKGATIVQPGTLKAADLIRSWANNGYVSPASIGYNESEADAAFAAGKALYQFEGSWQEPAFEQALGKKLGFFPVPVSGGSAHALLGDPGWGWAITKLSAHPGVAAQLINFLTSSYARGLVLKYQLPPDTPGPLPTGPSAAVFRQQVGDFDAAERAGSLTPAMDAAYPVDPSHNAVADMQLLGLGKMSPRAMLQDIQAGWQSFQATR